MTVSCVLKLFAFALVVSLAGYYVQPYLLPSSPSGSLFATGLLLGAMLGGLMVALRPSKASTTSSSANTSMASNTQASSAQQLDGHVLYVGNVPFNAREDEIRRLFEAYGEVKAIRMVTGGPKKRPKGYGFIEMDKAGAQAALALNGKDFAGRKLRVNPARNKEQ